MSISTRLFSLQMLDQFKFIEGRLQDIQTQIATGSRIPQSSDQPMDAVTLSARNELDQRISQYQKNLGKVSERLGWWIYFGRGGNIFNPSERVVCGV